MTKRIFLMLLLGGFCTLMQAQTEEDKVFDVVDEMPRFPGGDEALKKFLRSNIHYPDYAEPYQAEGVCTMLFVVDIYGNISDVVAKDCKITHVNEGSMASMTDEEKAAVKKECARQMAKEGLRVIRKMKRWNPGMKNGRPVRTLHTLNLSFSVI